MSMIPIYCYHSHLLICPPIILKSLKDYYKNHATSIECNLNEDVFISSYRFDGKMIQPDQSQCLGASGHRGRVMELWLQVYSELTLLTEVVTVAVNDPMLVEEEKKEKTEEGGG